MKKEENYIKKGGYKLFRPPRPCRRAELRPAPRKLINEK